MKSKHMTGKAFSIAVSDAIRHHIGERKALESKRTNAFEDRDAAASEKGELENHESPEYMEASRRHSDAIIDIDRLSKSIKWHNNQIDELIEKADDPQLDIVYDQPKPTDDDQMKFEDAAPKPGRLKPETPDPSMGDGVDEHLAASVNELDLREDLKGLLVNAGLTTIGRVAIVIDNGKDLGEVIQRGENAVSEVKRAVKKYRKEHRKAMSEAEQVA